MGLEARLSCVRMRPVTEQDRMSRYPAFSMRVVSTGLAHSSLCFPSGYDYDPRPQGKVMGRQAVR